MRKYILILFMTGLCMVAVKAQIPYFASTPGDGNLYGYTSLKVRPAQQTQETYTCFQYGIGSQFATGVDLYTGGGSAYWGALVRWGKQFSPYFGIGAEVTPSFNLNDNFKYSYTTAALYLKGNLTPDNDLFWCSNTWYGLNKAAENTLSNWEFLGYTFRLKKGNLTPMIGMEHDWKFEQKPDMLAGVYYSEGYWSFYVWGSDFFSSKNDPRVVMGVDFCLPTK